jgi:hypothetical protein
MKKYLNEVGTEFILDTGIVIGSVTSQYIKTYNPNGIEGTWTASLYSSYSELAKTVGTYLLKHSLVATDVTVSGDWKFQAFVGTASGSWYGETVKITFYDEFE